MRSNRIRTVILSALLLTVVRASDTEPKSPEPIEAPTPGYPAQLLAKDKEGRVELLLEVDGAGVVRDVRVKKSTDKRFEETCVEAFKRWRFEPAATSAETSSLVLAVTVKFRGRQVHIGRLTEEVPSSGTPPKALLQVAPKFPESLSHLGSTGRVIIRFVVDAEGKVRDPTVVTATHPGFEAPAIEAVLEWKFSPGIRDGKAVSTNVEQQIHFSTLMDGGTESFAVEKKGKNSQLPPELQVDTTAKPRNTVFAVHPYESAIKGAKGSAEVRLLVGANGRVIASKITKASSPEFGLSLAAAMESWTFDPALRDKQPVPSLINREFEFEKGARDSALDYEVAAIAERIRRGKFNPAGAGGLDAPLKPVFAAPPAYPAALNERGIAGSAKIEVIVDKKGRAVLPRIVEASEPEFGWAAATAAQRWRFNPPTVGKKPVEVKVAIPFKFVPPDENTEATEN